MAEHTATLYVNPGSHPCAAVEAAMALKGIEFRRVDLPALSQRLIGPALYGGNTVPGLRIGSQRVSGSRAIMRALDTLVAQPPLLPAPGSALYARALQAERWGDELLQPMTRRVIDAALVRRPQAAESYLAGARLPLPIALLRPALPLTARLLAAVSGAGDRAVEGDLAGLPRQLDRIDEWISDGVLGGDPPGAADLQIGSSIRLLGTIADVRPLLESHPAWGLTRHFPPATGDIPAGTLPAQWLAHAPAARHFS
jgi:glutathione S-transferase